MNIEQRNSEIRRILRMLQNWAVYRTRHRGTHLPSELDVVEQLYHKIQLALDDDSEESLRDETLLIQLLPLVRAVDNGLRPDWKRAWKEKVLGPENENAVVALCTAHALYPLLGEEINRTIDHLTIYHPPGLPLRQAYRWKSRNGLWVIAEYWARLLPETEPNYDGDFAEIMLLHHCQLFERHRKVLDSTELATLPLMIQEEAQVLLKARLPDDTAPISGYTDIINPVETNGRPIQRK